MFTRLAFPTVTFVLLAYQIASADTAIQILPPEVTLTGPLAEQQLIIQRVEAGTLRGPVEGEVRWESTNPEVASVDAGTLRAHENGSTTIRAVVTQNGRSRSAELQVQVKNADATQPLDFRYHVQGVLSKSGCNSGACHGALAGKGGFKLSLRGYDIAKDYQTITKQARGRRIELADPGRSLILTKPTGAVPHKGGIRFDVGTKPYNIIADWIAQGAAAPTEQDARLQKVEVLPDLAVLSTGQQQQVIVRAHYSDGRVEDVTRWSKFTATNEAVCRVDESGQVEVLGHGEGAVTAWFASKIAISRITVPYKNQVADDVYAKEEPRNFIDELVIEQLQRLNLPPSPASGDAEFLRRVYLDTIGTLPTAAESMAFLDDSALDKRDKLIDSLLDRPEFVDYWTYRWSDLLLINGTKLRPDAVKAFYLWIRKHVEKNTPWDEFSRQIVTAQGSSIDNGATNFYALHQDPETMTENACQAFLGLSITCAKCHNHPLEKWTNDQYYGMANLFARVRAKGWGGDSRNGNGRRTVYVAASGDLIQPSTGRAQVPTPLDGKPLDPNATEDRRLHLARWLTAPENPYFARAITNRVWANFFGVGLVEPVDDLRMSNPASNEKLLAAAADHLIAENYDLKALMRTILQSNAYQRTSGPLPENKLESRFYSRYYPRRLMAEVMLDAISQVTDVPSVFNQITFPGADKRKTDFYPKGTRALQLYDSAVDSYFLKTFGRNQRRITCECERSDEPTMVQVLHIHNGKTINEKLRSKDNAVDEVMAETNDVAEVIRFVYLRALARQPTPAEVAELSELVKVDDIERRILVEDIFWAVLSSREFLFNH